MEMLNECVHGCYPIDREFYEKGLEVKKILDQLKVPEKLRKDIEESFRQLKIDRIESIHEFRHLMKFLRSFDIEAGEKILDMMKKELEYKDGLGEPYVGSDVKRQLIVSGEIGKAMEIYDRLNTFIESRFGYKNFKLREWLQISPQGAYYHEMMERKRLAERTVSDILAGLSDLYQQKHLLEHDIRKLEERVKAFEQFEKGEDEALKADFVDLVDVNTGRHSLLTMQSENIFPTIMADFYRMHDEKDLLSKEEGGTGILAVLPESEKVILKKKWKLYRLWMETYGKEIKRRLEELKMRLISIETSIKQAENIIRPHVRTLLEITQSEKEDYEKMLDPNLIRGYSNSWRGIKQIAYKSTRKEIDSKTGEEVETHFDVLIINIEHLVQTFPQKEKPAPFPQSETILLDFKEYLVCKHVFEEVFKPQIDEKINEVKKFLNAYLGKEPIGEIKFEKIEEIERKIEEQKKKLKIEKDRKKAIELKEEIKKLEEKAKEMRRKGITPFKRKIKRALGDIDVFYVPLEEIKTLRAEMVGPPYTRPLYLDMKFGSGLFVMI
jgi:protein-arginine kinase activator protein McsA